MVTCQRCKGSYKRETTTWRIDCCGRFCTAPAPNVVRPKTLGISILDWRILYRLDSVLLAIATNVGASETATDVDTVRVQTPWPMSTLVDMCAVRCITLDWVRACVGPDF